MRLGIDAREIQNGVYTGIGRPLANFLNYFSKLENNDECVFFSTKKIPLDFGSKIRNVIIKGKITFYWDQIKLPSALKKEKIDIFYSPYYKVPLLASCKIVSAILDLMYLVFEEYRNNLSPLAKFYYASFGKRFAERADRILTCSRHSKQDIIRIYNIDDKKIEIIPLSISNIYRPEYDRGKIEMMKKNFGIATRYILYLGNFKPHKNVRNIVLSFNKIASEFSDLKLVLAGPKTHTYTELNILVDKLLLKDKVIFTGKITEEDTPHLLYSGAEAFVMPSLYEGFGLPAAEAMACGVPVVVSNCTSLPEVVQDAGILVNPRDIDQIAEAIKSILRDNSLKEELRVKGLKYAKDFYEEKIAKRTYDFFKNLL